MTKLKILAPHSILIEKTATELATVFYEVGRSQGLTSKCKDARHYARVHLEKFIPKAVDYLLDILNNPHTDPDAKVMIYDALSERMNDPNNVTTSDISGLPDIDITKLLNNIPVAPPSQQLKPVRDKPLVINVERAHNQKEINKRLRTGTAIGKVN